MEDEQLPVVCTFACAYCGKTQRVGARWGAGTADAHGRVYCTLECAWMVLLIDEHRAAPTLAARGECAPRVRRTRPARAPVPPLASTASESADENWHALVGMGALLGE